MIVNDVTRVGQSPEGEAGSGLPNVSCTVSDQKCRVWRVQYTWARIPDQKVLLIMSFGALSAQKDEAPSPLFAQTVANATANGFLFCFDCNGRLTQSLLHVHHMW